VIGKVLDTGQARIADRVLVTGVDIVELDRIEAVLRRFGQRFLDRVYTPQELAYCQGKVAPLAARFAAKEAASKALGTGLAFLADSHRTGVGPRQIEVLPAAGDRPTLVLTGAALAQAERLGLRGWSLSLSHSHTVAIAFVVAWGE
jgi:holo-[acyl-carrier protein] synthase